MVPTLQGSQSQVLYTRYEHGGQKVTVEDTDKGKKYGFSGKTYTSARKLLIDIHGKDLHLTFDRYFRLGKHCKNSGSVSQITVLDMFGSLPTPVPTCKNSGTVVIPRQYTGIREDGCGIDLAKRGREVAKLFFAGFGSELSRQGFDLDDVLQEVYKGLMIRNQGACPFDPEKSSFGHYVHMVARCVIANHQRKEGGRRDKESPGIAVYKEGMWSIGDVSESDRITKTLDSNIVDSEKMKDLIEEFHDLLRGQKVKPSLIQRSIRMVTLLAGGHTQNEIQEKLDINKSQLRKTLTFVREVGLDWRVGLHL